MSMRAVAMFILLARAAGARRIAADLAPGGGVFRGHMLGAYGNAVAPVVTRQSAEHVDPDDPTTWGKVGRNSACPCGSGKKYKHCHGAH